MQRPKNTLGGSLKTRFFSWTQTLGIEVVRTKDLVKALKFTPMQEAHVLTDLSELGLIIQLMRGKYLVPQKPPPGGRWTPSPYKILEVLMRELKAEYQVTGLAAFNSYGFDNQVPNEIAVYNTKLSDRRSIGGLSFWFIKVPRNRLGGQNVLNMGPDSKIVFGSLPRVILDAVYDYSRFNTLPRAYEWIVERQSKLDIMRDLVELAIKNGNVSTRRRLGYVLEQLKHKQLSKKLERSVSKTSSFIPLVPGQGRSGPVDRKWGIIINFEIKYELLHGI